MSARWKLGSVVLLSSLLAGSRLPAQAPPVYRRAASTAWVAPAVDSIARTDRWLRSPRYVRVDTIRGGVTWIQFEPLLVPLAARTVTPEAAATGFLARYGSSLFGVDPEHGSFELLAGSQDAGLHHYRYAQRYAGYSVMNGQLIIHVARVGERYAVQSANGWLFPRVVVPATPALSRLSAEAAALRGLGRASNVEMNEPPVVVADQGSYRLAYLIPVFDSTRYGIFTRYVDAENGIVFAEASDELRFAPNSESAAARSSPAPAVSSRRSAMAPTYVAASGFDALAQFQTFKVWDTETGVFELRDNAHPGASEVRIHNLSPNPLQSCNAQNIVTGTGTEWTNNAAGNEEVSAVHNLGETVTYFKNTFNRNGMQNNSGVAKACVHGSHPTFSALYSRAYKTLSFRQASGVDGPSVGAQDVVTHEFAHGVQHHEIGGIGFDTLPAPTATAEALSDFFGARHRNSPCMAGDVFGGGCFRYLHLDSISSCGSYPDCVGIRLASALWNATQTSSGYYATETDGNVYHGLASYLTASMDIYEAAHAILTRARIQEHWGGQLGASAELETRFYANGLQSHPPVTVQMSGTSQWTVTINNSYYTYDISFEIGSHGLNADGSVAWPE